MEKLLEKIIELNKAVEEYRDIIVKVTKPCKVDFGSIKIKESSVKIDGIWLAINLDTSGNISVSKIFFDTAVFDDNRIKLFRNKKLLTRIYLDLISPLAFFELKLNKDIFLKLLKKFSYDLYTYFAEKLS